MIFQEHSLAAILHFEGHILFRLPDDVPILGGVYTEPREFQMLMGQKIIGTAQKEVYPEELTGKEITLETYRKSEHISVTRNTL